MALIKSVGSFSAWTAVALNAVSESEEIDVSADYKTSINIQGFLDTAAATAGTGTEFVIQGSSLDSPSDEAWFDLVKFIELVGTVNPEPQLHLTDPMPTTTVLIPVTSTTGYVVADVPMPWIAIQDPTLANSELALLTAITANTNITIKDGTTRTHAKTTTILGNIAFSKYLSLDTLELSRLRLIVNNNYDSNGPIINYRFNTMHTTGI